jgi:hypothetical protein
MPRKPAESRLASSPRSSPAATRRRRKGSPLLVPGPRALPMALIVHYEHASQFHGALEMDRVDRPFGKRLDRATMSQPALPSARITGPWTSASCRGGSAPPLLGGARPREIDSPLLLVAIGSGFVGAKLRLNLLGVIVAIGEGRVDLGRLEIWIGRPSRSPSPPVCGGTPRSSRAHRYRRSRLCPRSSRAPLRCEDECWTSAYSSCFHFTVLRRPALLRWPSRFFPRFRHRGRSNR